MLFGRQHRGLGSVLSILIVLFPVLSAGAQQKEENGGCAASHYRIVAIPLRPNRMNSEGVVVGTAEQHRAAIWSEKGGLKILDLPAGFHVAEAIDVDARGDVLGIASTSNGSRRESFLFADSKVKLEPGDGGRANAVNAQGHFAGEAQVGGASTGPTLWRQGKAIRLGDCCGGRATALNDHDTIVGEAYDKEGRYQAFLWDEKNGLRAIGPADAYSTSVAINRAGHVIVYAFTQGSWIYKDGKLAPMELSKRWPSQPRALNDCDVVVGSFGSNADDAEAFLWDQAGGFRNLNDLVPKDSGWKLEVASSINDHGEIVGWGDHGSDEDAGFLLIPETR